MKGVAPSFEGVTGRVRVVPNRNSLGLLALLLAMWYAGASQDNGVAYLLCFMLTGVALVSILHTRANVRGLRLSMSRSICRRISGLTDGNSVPPRARGSSRSCSSWTGRGWDRGCLRMAPCCIRPASAAASRAAPE